MTMMPTSKVKIELQLVNGVGALDLLGAESPRRRR